MLTMIAHIFRAHRGVPTQSLLYFQVPLVITRNLHFARIKEVEGGNHAATGKVGAKRSIGGSGLPVQASCLSGRKSSVKKHERRIIRCVG